MTGPYSVRAAMFRTWVSCILALILAGSPFAAAMADETAQPAQGESRSAFEQNIGSDYTVSSDVYGVQVTLSGPSHVPVGETAQTELLITVDGVPQEQPEGVVYESSNEQVARITADGLVEGRHPGTAVIRAWYGTESGEFTLQVEASSAAPVPDRPLSKNAALRTLELEDRGFVTLTPFYAVEQQLGGLTVTKSLSDVMVGARNASFLFNSAGQVYKIVLDGETPVDAMRVGIRKSIANIADYTQFDHQRIDVTSDAGIRITDKKAGAALDVPAGKLVSFLPAEQQIAVLVDGTEALRTPNRLYAEPAAPGGKMQAKSFTRAYGNPWYRGVFEISLTSPNLTALKLINEVNMEQYLYQVVPSEMPASFGLEALRAQAVAARTYALSDYRSNRFADRGFHIDDSTLSQVYNNSLEHPLTTQAVNDTSGTVMMSGGELVDARFYSTSGGYGASKHEVWSDIGTNAFPGVPIPYLTARSYTYDPNHPGNLLEIDTQDEQALLAFYKDLSLTGYDSESYYFRWMVSLSRTELEHTINANLAGRQQADPNFVLTKMPDGSFASRPIPAEGIGTLKDMYVTKRGAGGNMMELVVEGTTGTYKILKEYNIRFTIRPSRTYTRGADVILHRAKGGLGQYDAAFQLKNPSILNSAFAAFEIDRDASGAPTQITFYGGGNGHGVGMSQYGASMLGGQGWSYEQILNSYYAGMELVKVNGTVLTLESLEASGPSTLAVGQSGKIAVAGVYSDGSKAAIAAGASFASSRPSVALVAPDGTVTAKGKGAATITVSYGGKLTSRTVSVTGDAAVERLELDAPATMWTGDRAQVVVTAFYSDDSSSVIESGASFASSRPDIASVDAAGVIAAHAVGTAEIKVSYGGAEASAVVDVVPAPALTRITIEGKTELTEGETVQLAVTGHYEDGSSRAIAEGVTFEVKQERTAEVTPDGVLTALKPGAALVTATVGDATAELRVLVKPK
ncbi:MAG TPA: SpoIID/LytB domain-containing protein [Paenibacillus sp.]|nr:SpoIID/LytB domain-containing protein [Paenibacillus sp.]